MAVLSAPFTAGALAYMIATFNVGYLWHLVLFNNMYQSLKSWSRFDDPVASLNVAAVCLQALLVSYMLPVYLAGTGASGPFAGARFGLWMAGLVLSVAVLEHSAKNRMACWEGFALLEGVYCILQYPLSCAFTAFARERASRVTPSSKKADRLS